MWSDSVVVYSGKIGFLCENPGGVLGKNLSPEIRGDRHLSIRPPEHIQEMEEIREEPEEEREGPFNIWGILG